MNNRKVINLHVPSSTFIADRYLNRSCHFFPINYLHFFHFLQQILQIYQSIVRQALWIKYLLTSCLNVP